MKPTQRLNTGRSSQFMDPGPPDGAVIHNLYAEATLPDTTPVNPTLTYDGASVSEISIPAGTVFTITDLLIGIGFVYWTLELDKGDGGGFKTLATFGFTLFSGAVTEVKTFKTPISIEGGTGVKIRFQTVLASDPTTPTDVSITVRCYTIDAAATPAAALAHEDSTVITVTDLVTVGPTEQVLNLSENAGTPGLSIPVPANTKLELTDFDVASEGNIGTFKLQHTVDGVTWFNIGALEVTGLGGGTNVRAAPFTPWKIDGGAAVAVRVAATTPAGASPVASTLLGLRLS